jgi:hypothetical protein
MLMEAKPLAQQALEPIARHDPPAHAARTGPGARGRGYCGDDYEKVGIGQSANAGCTASYSVLVGQARLRGKTVRRGIASTRSLGVRREALAALRATAAQHEPSALRGIRARNPWVRCDAGCSVERAFHRGLRLRNTTVRCPQGSPGGRKMGAEG